MATQQLSDINADGGKVYLITRASLRKILSAIKAQRPIAGNGISLEETADGIVVKIDTPPT